MSDNNLAISEGKGLIKAVDNGELVELIKPLINEIHLFDTFIAGTTHLKDETVLKKLKVGDNLSLLRENNKFDSNAILILNNEKQKLGYIPERDNVIFARLMDAGKMLKVKVEKIDYNNNFYQIAIGIYLVDF